MSDKHNEIELKDKNIKSNVKIAILAFAIGSSLISLTPNIKYKIALLKAKNNKEIIRLINDKNNKEENIKTIYELAINKNNNIPIESKKILIKAFEENFIEPYYNLILDETIYNMYAVASTQRVKEMSKTAKKYGWWSGDYNSYTNTIYLYSYNSKVLVAHEQLHAILKTGLFDMGYTKGLNGYALNEALTVSLIKGDDSYYDQFLVSDYLGLIIGYDKLYKYYMLGDLDGLKNELNKYIEKEETEKLIRNMDVQVFNDYGLIFLTTNNVGYVDSDNENTINILDRRKIFNYKMRLEKENTEILMNLFESKYNCKVEDSNLGRIIFGNGNDLFDKDLNPNDPIYDIYYNDPNSVKIFVQKFNHPFFNNNENYFRTYFVKTEELEKFDIDQALKLAKNNGKHY